MFLVKQQFVFVFRCGWMPEDLPTNSGKIKD
nr:MAG TPA: glutathione synthase [Bacteriophage sp.]